MMEGSVRAPCVACGTILHTGEGRITISLTVPELIELSRGAPNNLRDRLLCAASMLDDEAVRLERFGP